MKKMALMSTKKCAILCQGGEEYHRCQCGDGLETAILCTDTFLYKKLSQAEYNYLIEIQNKVNIFPIYNLETHKLVNRRRNQSR